MRKKEPLAEAAKALSVKEGDLTAYKAMGCPGITQTAADVLQVAGWLLRRLSVEFHALRSGDETLTHISTRDEQQSATDILAVASRMGEYIVRTSKRG